MTKSQVLKPICLHGLALLFAVNFLMPEARAAISPKSQSAGGLQATKDALELSMLERIQQLKSDSNAYSNLKALMESKSETFELRYKATTALAKIAGVKAKPEMAHAMSSPDWFIRNAGLIGMSTLDRTEALVWARKLLNDKALVVRSAAVDVITQARDTTSTNLLWQKLYAKENFRNKQSLYIRRHIVEALSEIDGKEHAAKFVALLQDKDDSLHEPAIEALERITHQAVATPGAPLQDRRAQWQKWYKTNKATL